MLTLFFSLGIVWQLIMEEISYANSKGPSKKRLSKRLLIFGGLFLLVLVLLGSAIYFITQDNKTEVASETTESIETTSEISLPAEEEVTQTPAPSEEVSPTPEKSTTPSKTPSKAPTGAAAKSSVSIVVQNGSGVSGAAASVADVLKTAGYTISSTGNADTTDYTDVTIKVKNSEKASLSDIEKALAKEYTVGDTSADLPESTSYDVLVIVGK